MSRVTADARHWSENRKGQDGRPIARRSRTRRLCRATLHGESMRIGSAFGIAQEILGGQDSLGVTDTLWWASRRGVADGFIPAGVSIRLDVAAPGRRLIPKFPPASDRHDGLSASRGRQSPRYAAMWSLPVHLSGPAYANVISESPPIAPKHINDEFFKPHSFHGVRYLNPAVQPRTEFHPWRTDRHSRYVCS